MEVILLLIRIFLFAVFAVAAIGKFLDLEGSEKSVKALGTPADLAKTFAVLIPFAELVFAVCLLFVGTSWLGAIGVFLFLLIFMGGMIAQMAKGNAPDCHCFGAIHSEPVSKKSLIRNGVFAILALLLILSGRQNQGLSFSEMTNEFALQFILGLAVLVALGAVIFYLKKISEQQNQIMRRIDILELISHDGSKEVERENVGSLQDALPIGAVAPEFVLENIGGREVTLEHLLIEGKPLLFFFVSPNCEPCTELLPEIETWQTELENRFNFVFISSGNAAENIEKFGTAFKHLLIQKEKEAAELFYAVWTPTALVINSNGIIASRPAVGDGAIRELVEKIKAENESEYFVLSNKDKDGHEHGKSPKIGETVPDFSLTDLEGKEFTTKDFQNRRTLVTFWSMTCPHCINMMEELKNWDKEKGADAPDLLVFSDGEAKAHQELELNAPILLDKGYKTAEKLGMFGTPSAVLVNEKGKIISETAVGAGNIWALIGKRK
ncbi:hypothetical protein BH10ACI1_BH10ACI1_11790 [soil metagenome]